MGLVTRQSKQLDDLFAKLAKEPVKKTKKPKDKSQSANEQKEQ